MTLEEKHKQLMGRMPISENAEKYSAWEKRLNTKLETRNDVLLDIHKGRNRKESQNEEER